MFSRHQSWGGWGPFLEGQAKRFRTRKAKAKSQTL